jgi:hypothetical protein
VIVNREYHSERHLEARLTSGTQLWASCVRLCFCGTLRVVHAHTLDTKRQCRCATIWSSCGEVHRPVERGFTMKYMSKIRALRCGWCLINFRQFDILLFQGGKLHDSCSTRPHSERHPVCRNDRHSNPEGGFHMLDMPVLVVRGNGIDILWPSPARRTLHAILTQLAPSPAEDAGPWPKGDFGHP